MGDNVDERSDQKLPVTADQAYDAEAAEGAEGADSGGDGADEGAAFESDAGPHPEVEEVPSWRLITTLAVAGALAGLLIVGVFQWAQPQILENRARVLRTAIQDVLASPDRVQTLYVQDGQLSEQPPAGVDTTQAERVFLGYDANGHPVGYAITGEKPGYQDVISLIFGYDPGADEVLGMRVLESKETPGLGDKIFKDSTFVAEFRGVRAPIEGVKDGGDEPDEVDMITGATISSEAVIEIINMRVDALGSALDEYIQRAGGGTP
ncbi:MAG: FMN-binding protein [Longimicrobiales bacterium]